MLRFIVLFFPLHCAQLKKMMRLKKCFGVSYSILLRYPKLYKQCHPVWDTFAAIAQYKIWCWCWYEYILDKPSYLALSGASCVLHFLFFLDSFFPPDIEPAPCNSDPLWLSGTCNEWATQWDLEIKITKQKRRMEKV